MSVSFRVAFLSVAVLGFSIGMAGCGGPDNEKGVATNADGTATKDVTSGPVKSADEIYKASQKNTGSAGLMESKGYKK